MEPLLDKELILDQFRDWIDQTWRECESLDEIADCGRELPQPLGLRQMVETLIPLRHEVKLLTKALRTCEKRDEASSQLMQSAIQQFDLAHQTFRDCRDRTDPTSSGADHHGASKTMVEGLADLDEALNRGRKSIEHARQQVLLESEKKSSDLIGKLDQLYRMQPWWRRVLCRPWHSAAVEVLNDRVLGPQIQFFDSFLQGYDLIQKRLHRTMDAGQIIRMNCVGRQFDPNCMTAVETVAERGLPGGRVVDELRLGYFWGTTVLRFADVKVVGDK